MYFEVKNENPQELRVYRNENVDKRPVLFTMIGLPGSGKSTIADNLVVERNTGEYSRPVIHSSDSLRKELFGKEGTQGDNGMIFSELHKRMKQDLKDGKDVVFDATNVNKKFRINFIRELKNIDCFNVAVCVMTPYELCLKNNVSRERVVPENVIRSMYLKWCPPSKQEGFDDIVLCYSFGDIDVKTKYNLHNFFGGEINACSIEQENRHHKRTIGDHCIQAAVNIIYLCPDNYKLYLAALLHDIGKPFTKSHLNAKGEETNECHYYNHQHCGAYDSLFYTYNLSPNEDEMIHIANLIYYHMHPFLSWKQSEKALKRDRDLLGEDFFNEVMLLHRADRTAQ